MANGFHAFPENCFDEGILKISIQELRKHGISARKPLHELRKELGAALITAEHGIYAASRVLRHSNVATTAAHYTDLKTRPTIAVGAWLKPDNVVPMPGVRRHERRNATPKRRRAR